MATRYHWLVSGIAGALLLAPSGARAAQETFGQPLSSQVGAAAGTRAGQPGAFRPPDPIRPGQPVSVLVFPFGYAADAAAGGLEAAPPPAAPGGAAPGAAVPGAGAIPGGAGDAGTATITAGPATPAEPVPGSALSQAQRDVADTATATVKAGLMSTPAFTVTTYREQSALVTRARNDGTLRPEDLGGVISNATLTVDPARARTVAYRLGFQSFLVGTLDLKEDPQANTADVTLETQLINSTTGEPIQVTAVTGGAAGANGVIMPVIRERAAQDAALKTIPALGVQLIPARDPAAEKAAEKARKEAAKAAEKARKDAEKAAKESAEKAAKQTQPLPPRDVLGEYLKDTGNKGFFPPDISVPPGPDVAAPDGKLAPGEPAPPVVPVEPTPRRIIAPRPDAAAVAPAAPVVPPATATPAAPPATSPDPATVTQPAAAASVAVPAPGSAEPARGAATTTGVPIPYGYALDANGKPSGPRDRTNLRVPAWLGLAGFISGISFLF